MQCEGMAESVGRNGWLLPGETQLRSFTIGGGGTYQINDGVFFFTFLLSYALIRSKIRTGVSFKESSVILL